MLWAAASTSIDCGFLSSVPRRARPPVVGYNAWRLYLELQPLSYRGKYETVKRAVRPLRQAWHQVAVATVRFETAPGVQWQADWSSGWLQLRDRPQRVQLFTMVSCYSRRLHAEVAEDQTLPTLLSCHEHAFDWFEGLPAEILYDNPKTIVLTRDPAGTHVLDRRLNFALVRARIRYSWKWFRASPKVKFQVVLEALTGDKTLGQIAKA